MRNAYRYGSQGRGKFNTGRRQVAMPASHTRQMIDDRCDDEDRSGEVMAVYTDADFEGRVEERFSCPMCGQDGMDKLVWLDDDRVSCATCGTIYAPMFQARV